jgi:hypothetical protein
MGSLERGLDGIPQVMPADIRNISSGFGYRRDPFNGRAAMHSGLDFRGPMGAPIHAAADGTVSFVGNKSGYGRVVEITHGDGMMTRYAHMSRFESRVGQQVGVQAHAGEGRAQFVGHRRHKRGTAFTQTMGHGQQQRRASDAEADEHEARNGHQDFAADGRAEEVANKVHRKSAG